MGWLKANLYGFVEDMFNSFVPIDVRDSIESGNKVRAWVRWKKVSCTHLLTSASSRSALASKHAHHVLND